MDKDDGKRPLRNSDKNTEYFTQGIHSMFFITLLFQHPMLWNGHCEEIQSALLEVVKQFKIGKPYPFFHLIFSQHIQLKRKLST